MTEQSNAEWRAGLKVGDEVILSRSYEPVSLDVVSRVTATQIVVGYWKFRKADGREIGGVRWHSVALVRPTPELRERAARLALLALLNGTKWAALTTDQIRRVAAIANEPQVAA